MIPLILALALSVIGAAICLAGAVDRRADAIVWFAKRSGRLLAVERTRRRLAQANMTWLPPQAWIGFHVACAVAAAVIGYMVFGMAVLAGVGFVTVYSLLGQALELWRSRRLDEWREALLESVRYGAAVMNRGGSATDMLTALSLHGPVQVRSVFSELAEGTTSTGRPISATALVSEVQERVAEPMFDDVALALRFHWTKGARLVSALDAVAQEWDENMRLQREAKALRAGVEASVMILALLPLVFLGLLRSLAPPLLEPFRTPPGQLTLGVTALWMVTGYRVLQRISAPPSNDRLVLKERTS